MKNFHPIQFIDIRFQVDHVSPEKIQRLEHYRGDPDND